MARIPERWDGHSQWYFVTIVTRNRQPVFAAEQAREVLKAGFRKTHRYYSFRLGALVILPDHWHALIRPAKGVVIEQIVGAVKRNVLRGLGHGGVSFWLPRFLDHRIRNHEDFYGHVEYIRLNGFKHGLALEGEAYRWCFVHPDPFG